MRQRDNAHCATRARPPGFPMSWALARARGPQWPPGFVGSITHCDGYRAAAVARARDALTIGLDAEPKAWFPLTRRWLGFEEADITFSAADGVFEARLLVPATAVGGVPLSPPRWHAITSRGRASSGSQAGSAFSGRLVAGASAACQMRSNWPSQ